MKLIILAWAFLASATFCSAQGLPCSVLPQMFPEPGFNMFSRQDDVQIGKEDLLTHQLVRDEMIEQYLQNIVQKVLRYSPESAQLSQYTVYLVNSDEKGAEILPGGIILVSLGLIVSAPSDDLFAYVLAHEIAHEAMRHLTMRKTLRELRDKKIVQNISWSDMVALRVAHELEADYFAAVVGFKAGFNSRSMQKFLKKRKKHVYYSDPSLRLLMLKCFAPASNTSVKISSELKLVKKRAKQLLK